LNDILRYSDSEEKHVDHIEGCMHFLVRVGLYLKLEKYEFHIETIRYFELSVSTMGFSIDLDKVETE
jgi:hypothetical protein